MWVLYNVSIHKYFIRNSKTLSGSVEVYPTDKIMTLTFDHQHKILLNKSQICRVEELT